MVVGRDGRALKIPTSNGNEEYYETVKVAAQKAKFPAFTNPEGYRDFQQVGFDKRGQVIFIQGQLCVRSGRQE